MSDSTSQPHLGQPNRARFCHFQKRLITVTFIFRLNKLLLLKFFPERVLFFKRPGIFVSNLRGFKLTSFHSHSEGACYKFQLGFDLYSAKFDQFMCYQMRNLIGKQEIPSSSVCIKEMYISHEGNDIFLRLSCEIYFIKAILDWVSGLHNFLGSCPSPRVQTRLCKHEKSSLLLFII